MRIAMKQGLLCCAFAAGILASTGPALADAPATTVAYQPMVSTGLAAGYPFEAWFVFDKSADPRVPGYAIPPGASIRFTFPEAFTPKAGGFLAAVMLKGWSQGAVAANFSTALDSKDPHTVVVRFTDGIVSGPAEDPGLKAIHLRTNVMNPAKTGDYPVGVQFVDAGPLSGATKATAHITAKPVPNVAAYNQLHQGKDEDWQHVKAGAETPLPVDFLVTLPDTSRSIVSLKSTDVGIVILSDGNKIGSIKTEGVPLTLTPQAFGPGYSRVGIIEVHVRAGTSPGMAKIVAALDGGTQYPIQVVVEAP